MADKLEDVGFEELAREFQQVLSNISQVGDKGLERFREEYEKIYVALRKVGSRTVGALLRAAARRISAPPRQSHDNELRLIKKVRELNNEIVGNGPCGRLSVRAINPPAHSRAALCHSVSDEGCDCAQALRRGRRHNRGAEAAGRQGVVDG